MSTVARIAADVASGRTSAERVVADALTRVAARDDGAEPLNAIIAVDGERALDAARAIDERCARGEQLPLAGVPVVVKDNICTLDLPTTCGSAVLAGYVSPYEATVVRRLRAAGAVVIGKANLDEFAMGSTTAHSLFGRTHHPRDPARVPGGSSGGSAAAVGAALVPVALGSDTGGSVRQPAAFCGVVGFKPTYGRVSRYGLVGFASSLDHVGVFGGSVHDAALALQAIAGADPRDATSAMLAVPDLAAGCGHGVAGMSVGVVRAYVDAADAAASTACNAAADALRTAGAVLRDVQLGDPAELIEPYRVLSCVEAVTNLARFDGVRFGARVEASGFHAMRAATRAAFGPAVRDRLAYGERITRNAAEYGTYARARATRARVTDELRSALQGVDVLLTPATPGAAFRIADAESSAGHDSDVFLLAANFAGIPALSVPFGESSNLPLGMHLMAPWWQEHALVRVAGALERAAAR